MAKVHKQKKHRLHIELPLETYQALLHLKDRLEAESETEAIRRAVLFVYKLIGEELYIRRGRAFTRMEIW